MSKKEEVIAMENMVDLKNIKTVIQGGITIIEDEKLVRAALESMANSIPDDVEVTIETLTVSRSKLSEIRGARYALQNISKANVSYLNGLKSENKLYLDDLIGIISPKELILKEQITVIEDDKKRIKEEKEAQKRERIRLINERIYEKTQQIMAAAGNVKSDKDLTYLFNLNEGITDEWIKELEEYAYMGENLKLQAEQLFNDASEKLEELKIARLKEIEQEKEVAKLKKENEARLKQIEKDRKAEEKKQKAIQDEKDKKFAKSQADLEAANKKIEEAVALKLEKEQVEDAKKIIRKNSTTMKKLGFKSNVVMPNKLTIKKALSFIEVQEKVITKENERLAQVEEQIRFKAVKMAFGTNAQEIQVDVKGLITKVNNFKHDDKQLKNLLIVIDEAVNELTTYLN